MGEIGVLDSVRVADSISNKCYLAIRHQGERYVGCLAFSNPGFCALITTFLRSQIGRAIDEIGDTDISHLA
jgi:hypothetical protein